MVEEKNENNKSELALVLSSGGSRGIAQIGIIKVLEKNNISPNVVVGTSIGALVGGMYAAGCLDKFEKTLIKKNNREIKSLFRTWPSKEGLIKTEKLENEIKKILNKRKIEELDKKFFAVSVDIVTGKKVLIDKGYLYEAILASIAIPVLFPPIHKQEMLLVDGGIEAPLDVEDGFEYAKKVIAVNTTLPLKSLPKKKKYNLIDIYQRAQTIVQEEILNHSLEKYKENLIVLNPDVAGITKSVFDFSKAKELIKKGREEAEKHLEEIKKLVFE